MTDRRRITLSVIVIIAVLLAVAPASEADLALNRSTSASSAERDLAELRTEKKKKMARANDGNSATRVWAADYLYLDDIRADDRFKVIQAQGNRANVGAETSGWLRRTKST